MKKIFTIWRAILIAIALVATASAVETSSDKPIEYVPERDPGIVQQSGHARGDGDEQTFVIHSMEFATQTPDDPAVYDSRNIAYCSGVENPANIGLIKWVEPSYGVNSETGVLITLGGIGSQDCPDYDTWSGDGYFFTYEHAVGYYPERESWPDDKNLIVVNIYYRNMRYMMPYDFGKNQVADVLNGTRAILDQYPEIDRTRLYLYGGSGGGHLALQTLQFAPHWWAEVWAASGLTVISTPDDVQENGYTYFDDGDANGSGWYVNMGGIFLTSTERYRAERLLRAPQLSAVVHSAVGNRAPKKIGVFHGEADPLVVAQHLRDYRDNVLINRGISPNQRSNVMVLENDPVTIWEDGPWAFCLVPNGNHYLSGGPWPDWSTREAALESLDSDDFNRSNGSHCFTRHRNEEPDLTVNDILPPVTATDNSTRWTYEIVDDDGLIKVHTRELAIDQVAVWFEADGHGTIAIENQAPDNVYSISDVINIEAIAEDGYQFDGWYINGEFLSRDPTFSVEPTSDTTFVALFSIDTSDVSDWMDY